LRLSIIIPLLNEAAGLEALHQRVAELAPRIGREIEMIFVDDGSTDESFEVLQRIRAADPRVKIIRLSRNFGSHSACLAGLEHTSGEHAVILAADLQDPPELVIDMLREAEKGRDVVWAFRETRHDPTLTVLSSMAYNRLMRRIALPNFPPQGFDFVLVSRRVIEHLTRHTERNTSLFGQMLWLGFGQASIPYTRLRRRSGRSKWTLAKKVKLAIDSFVSFSYFPIRLMSVLGVASALLGVAYALFTVVRRLLNQVPVEGWASLMVVVLIVGGMQMVMLGIIGEYLWRTLDEARGRPPFVVIETAGFEGTEWISKERSAS
jgi:glycosyltransferase involved in cell wall biosynthesis